MPGVRPLSGFQLGVEATKGTAVATTREFYPDTPSMFDAGVGIAFHEGAQRGTMSNITHATLLTHNPTISYSSEPSIGVAFDDLIIPGSQLLGAQSGAGGAADKTWTFTPNQTVPTFSTYTANVFDASQAYEIEYCFMPSFTISAGFDDLTQISWDMVGRQSTKVTVDSVAANNAISIPSALWTVKYAAAQASLTGASVLANTMRSFSLTVDTGLRPRFYADGNKYFGQGITSGNIGGTLQMVWDSTSDAVTQYDLYLAQTVAFFRLKAIGPVLGGTFYSASFDVAVIWEDVQPLGSESDGVMEYVMTGRLVYDATWGQAVVPTIVSSLAALP